MPDYMYYQPVPYEVNAAEMLKAIGEQPHMLLRIHIRGGHFPHRDAPEFARIRNRRRTFEALYCQIDEDEGGFRAYFPTDVPLRGVLSVGYGNEVVAEFEFERLQLEPQRLELPRIETDFHRVTLADPGAFKPRR